MSAIDGIDSLRAAVGQELGSGEWLTVSQDRINAFEPAPPEGAVTCPATLSSGAQAVWADVAPVALAMRTLTPADVWAFSDLCALLPPAPAISAEKSAPEFKVLVMKATVDGDGNVHLEARENPVLRMERQVSSSLRPYFEKFGLEPVGRARIQVKKPEQPVSKWKGALA